MMNTLSRAMMLLLASKYNKMEDLLHVLVDIDNLVKKAGFAELSL